MQTKLNKSKMKNFMFPNYESYVKAVTRGNELGGNDKVKSESEWVQYEKDEISAQRASAHLGG